MISPSEVAVVLVFLVIPAVVALVLVRRSRRNLTRPSPDHPGTQAPPYGPGPQAPPYGTPPGQPWEQPGAPGWRPPGPQGPPAPPHE